MYHFLSLFLALNISLNTVIPIFMQYIKLDAIPSTNDFLKDYVKNESVKNYITVIAHEQTNGKGQMGSVWKSQAGKNLTMSVYVSGLELNSKSIFTLNKSIALSILDVLREFKFDNLTIKWPNDIMAENKKIGGILIENVHSATNGIYSIVGIGLNINQTIFDNLPQASSTKLIFGKELDVQKLATKVAQAIKYRCESLKNALNTNGRIEEEYWNALFKKNSPMVFEDVNKDKFMGIIIGVSSNGLLQIQREDDSILEFGIKEVKMLY
ncbi:MAG: BirA family biotin operon repressor/biotin-[acetyl-CoA-carboxylase] ligase [Flavobacterium sp.]|jgi:BirA family biotin operon repressor/biotin-[acetyl-CoA-carboxylase] ligase